MIQTQTKWKLGALLLSAPLLMPFAAQAKDYYEQTSETADGAVFRLKSGHKWTGPKGEVYLFHKDGRFECRTPRESVYFYSKDFGRFTVRPVNESDESYIGNERFILQLKITSSAEPPRKKGGKSKVVKRDGLRVLPVKFFSDRPDNDDRYDPNYSFVVRDLGRFTMKNPYDK